MNSKVSSPSIKQVERETINEYITKHQKWSMEKFGNTLSRVPFHSEDILIQMEMEIASIRRLSPDPELRSYVNIIILAIDAAIRRGYKPYDISEALIGMQGTYFRARTSGLETVAELIRGKNEH